MMDEHLSHEPPDALWRNGLLCRCPACGDGKLFRGLLTVAPTCSECGFDLQCHEEGDGPAYIVMTIVSLLVMALAMWLELAYAPPIWLHMVLWLPFILLVSLPLLRISKALLIAHQYRHRRHSFDPSREDGDWDGTYVREKDRHD